MNDAALSRILVVEPRPRYAAVLGRRLSEAGYLVSIAADAVAAIAELHRTPVDLVLAELNLPQSGCSELTSVIRGEMAWRDLPIMLITGRSEPSGPVRAYGAGADDVILKPFHFEVLFARIDRRIARARSFAALRTDNARLDARITERAIQIGELRDHLTQLEAERRRLEALARQAA